MKKTIVYIAVLWCAAISISHAQDNTSPSSVFIVRAAANQPAPDSIYIRYFKGTISESSQFSKMISPVKTADGSFTFSLPGEQNIAPFWIQFRYGKAMQRSLIYYAEPADRVTIDVTKSADTIRAASIGLLAFSGAGAAKYSVRQIMDELEHKLAARIVSLNGKYYWDKISTEGYHNSPEFKKYLSDLVKITGENSRIKQDTLSKYKSLLGTKMTDFYRYEIGHNLEFFSPIRIIYEKATESAKAAIAAVYFSEINHIVPTLPVSDSFQYGVYSRWMLERYLSFDLYLKNKSKYAFDFEYNEIKKIADKEVRDILLTRLLVNGTSAFVNDASPRDSCLLDALNFIQRPELRAALKDGMIFTKGSEIEDYAFFDAAGQKVKLSDMKGKVFLLDFYYYGCAPCTTFGRRFKAEIYPEFANNPDFKVLSVDGADTEEGWRKAIESKLYTVPNSINLITGVQFDHPIFKKYNMTGFPWALLIGKDGRVIDFDMSNRGSEEAQKLIRTALAK